MLKKGQGGIVTYKQTSKQFMHVLLVSFKNLNYGDKKTVINEEFKLLLPYRGQSSQRCSLADEVLNKTGLSRTLNFVFSVVSMTGNGH